jgi:hypothetical protein
LTTATSALAQASTQWTIGTGTFTSGRSEGLTEAAGPVTLDNYTAGSVTDTAYFVITYGAAVVPGTVYLQCAAGSGTSPFIGDPSCASQISTVVSGDTVTLNWIGGPVYFPGQAVNSGITILVRLNAYNGGTCIPKIYASGQGFNGVTTTTLGSNLAEVLDVNCGPALSVGLGSTGLGVYCSTDSREKCYISQTAYVLLCLGVLKGNTQYERYFTVNVGEEFTKALTSQSYEDYLDTGSTSPGEPGLVTNGTLITVVLNNIPANFGITAEPPIPCEDVSTTAPGYCASGTIEASVSGKDSYWNYSGSNGGTATFEYTITQTDEPGGKDNLNLPFKFYSKGPIGTSALPCITLTIYKNPEDPPATTAIPRFYPVPEGTVTVVCFNNCETNILYPLVLNVSPWDTDLAVSNTTMDPLGILGANASSAYYPGPPNLLLEAGSATPQSGNCYNFFYAAGALIDSWTIGPIAAGSTWAYDLGGSRPKTAGYTGYVWTKCEFSEGYGYAAIDYDLGLNNGVLGNYLAINIPDPEWSPRDLNGDGMGENTLTPVNLARQLQKQLSGLYGH